jgi:uncharacterized membrane protein
MARRLVLLLVVPAVAVAGCGGNARDAVRAKVQQYADATRGHDYHALCTQVLAPSLVEHLTAHGINCEVAMQAALQSVHNPMVSIGKVAVHGSSATVIALTMATGEAASIDTFDLRQTRDGWRITSMQTM